MGLMGPIGLMGLIGPISLITRLYTKNIISIWAMITLTNMPRG